MAEENVGGIKFTVEADHSSVDKTTESMKRMEKQADKLDSSAKSTGKAMKQSALETDKYGNSLTQADKAAGRFIDSSGRMREANGKYVAGLNEANGSLAKFDRLVSATLSDMKGMAAAGAAAAAAIGAVAAASSETNRELEAQARQAGVAVNEYQKMVFASQRAGVAQDEFGDITKDARDKIGDFLVTGGGELADFFETVAPKVGVTADQFKNLSGPEVLGLFIDTLEKANVSEEKAIFFTESLANEASRLRGVFGGGGEAIAEAGRRMDELGTTISQLEVKRVADLSSSFSLLGTTISNATTRSVSAFKEEIEEAVNTTIRGVNLMSEGFIALFDQLRDTEARRSLKGIQQDIGLLVTERERLKSGEGVNLLDQILGKSPEGKIAELNKEIQSLQNRAVELIKETGKQGGQPLNIPALVTGEGKPGGGVDNISLLNNELDDLKQKITNQVSQFGATERAIAKASAKQEAINAATLAGTKASGDYLNEIEMLVDELFDLKDAQQAANETLELYAEGVEDGGVTAEEFKTAQEELNEAVKRGEISYGQAEATLKRLAAGYDAAEKAASDLEKIQRKGAITQSEYNEAVELLGDKFLDGSAVGLQKYDAALKEINEKLPDEFRASGKKASEFFSEEFADGIQSAAFSGGIEGAFEYLGSQLGQKVSDAVSKSVSDSVGSSIGNAAGGAIGGLAGGLVGGSVASLIGGLFGGSKKTKLSAGFEFEIVDNQIAEAFSTERIKRSNIFGSSTREYKTAVSDATISGIQNSINLAGQDIASAASAFGVTAQDFSGSIKLANGSLNEAIELANDETASVLFAASEDWALAGESAFNTLMRVADLAKTVSGALEIGGFDASAIGNISAQTDELIEQYSESFNELMTRRVEIAERDTELIDSIGGTYNRTAATLAGVQDELKALYDEAVEIDPQLEELSERISGAAVEAAAIFNDELTSALAEIEGIPLQSSGARLLELSRQYKEQFFTAEELQAEAIESARERLESFSDLGIGVDTSMSELRSAIEDFTGSDAFNAEGLARYLSATDALIDFNEAIGLTTDSTGEFVEAVEKVEDLRSLQIQLLRLQGDEAAANALALEMQKEGASEARSALLDQIAAQKQANDTMAVAAAAQREAEQAAIDAARELESQQREAERVAEDLARQQDILNDLNVQRLKLLGDEESLEEALNLERQRKLNGLNEEQTAVQNQIFALEDAAAAAEKAAAANRLLAEEQERAAEDARASAERRRQEAQRAQESLNDQRERLLSEIFNLTASVAEKRQAEIDALHPSLRALQERIFAINDEQDALKSAADAEKERTNALQSAIKTSNDLINDLQQIDATFDASEFRARQQRIDDPLIRQLSSQTALRALIGSAKERIEFEQKELSQREKYLTELARLRGDEQFLEDQRLAEATNSNKHLVRQIIELENANREFEATADEAARFIDDRANHIRASFESIFDGLNAEIDAVSDSVSELSSISSELSSAIIDRAGIPETATIGAVLATARAGGEVSRESVSTALTGVRAISEQRFSSAEDRDFAELVATSQIFALNEIVGDQLSSEEQTLSLLQQELDQQQTFFDAQLIALDAIDSGISEQVELLKSGSITPMQAQQSITSFNPTFLAPSVTIDQSIIANAILGLQEELRSALTQIASNTLETTLILDDVTQGSSLSVSNV